MADDRRTLGEVAPVAAADRPLALQQPPPGSARRAAAENANVTAFTQYARCGPGGGDERPADERARPRSSSTRRAGAARSRSRARRRRRGSAARRARPAGRTRCRCRRRRRARRSPPPSRRTAARRRRRGGRGRSAIISPLRESRSTSGPSRRPRKTAGRMFAISSAADPPAGVRAVVDVDLERDHRQPVAEPGAEGREEEQAEAAVPEQRQPRAKRPTDTDRTRRDAQDTSRNRSAQDASERGGEEVDLVGRPDRDADRRRGAEAVQRPDDHALAQQPLVEAAASSPTST